MAEKDLVEYIKDHIYLFKDRDITSLYSSWVPYRRDELTVELYAAGIDPLRYMNYVPSQYLCGHTGKISRVVIPDNITGIGDRAFSGSDVLEYVKLSSDICTIGDNAFEYTPSLKEISIPEKLITISSNTFCHSGICKIKFHTEGQLSFISDNAFRGCGNLKEVEIPEGVVVLGNYSFYHCTGIKTVSLPNTLMSIGERAFENCISLELVQFNGTVEEFRNLYIGKRAFENCRSNISIVCSDGEYLELDKE